MCSCSLRLLHTQKNEPNQSHTVQETDFKFKKEKVLRDNFLSSFLGHHLYYCFGDLCKEGSCKVKLRQKPGFPALLYDSPYLPFMEEECPGHLMLRGVHRISGS